MCAPDPGTWLGSCGGPHTSYRASGSGKTSWLTMTKCRPALGQLLDQPLGFIQGQELHIHTQMKVVCSCGRQEKTGRGRSQPCPLVPGASHCPPGPELTGSLNCSLTERMTGSVSSSLEASWSAFMSLRPSMLHIYGDGRGLTVYLVPITLPGSSSLDTWLGRAGRVGEMGGNKPTTSQWFKMWALEQIIRVHPQLCPLLWDHGQVSASVSPCV